MEMQVKNISHKLIDSLSDGVFSIAMTLLGLNVVSLVPEISHSKKINSALAHNWPTFTAYLLGFVVLFSMWYSYHTISQYVVGTNTYVVWSHGLTMAWVALMPFGVAILADNLNTSNRKWGVFYFGVCLFGQYWTSCIQFLFMTMSRADFSITFTEDMPLSKFSKNKQKRVLVIFNLIPASLGLVLVSLSMIFPWIALIGFGLFVLGNANPVIYMNKLNPLLVRL